jgi:ankyrin repeat protein
LSDSLNHYVLLKYITHYWHLHVSNNQTALWTSLSNFFKDDTLLQAYGYFMGIYYPAYYGFYPALWKGPTINHGHTSLHAAAAAGLELVVKWIIANNANVNLLDVSGRTALTYACESGDLEMANLLITNGTNVNLGQFRTALQTASQGGHEAVVKLLIDSGADVNKKGKSTQTALVAASQVGHEAVVKLLIIKGADVNKHGKFSQTALVAASKGGHEAVVKLLIANNADVNKEGNNSQTALVAASQGGHTAVVKLLIDNGAKSKQEE